MTLKGVSNFLKPSYASLKLNKPRSNRPVTKVDTPTAPISLGPR